MLVYLNTALLYYNLIPSNIWIHFRYLCQNSASGFLLIQESHFNMCIISDGIEVVMGFTTSRQIFNDILHKITKLKMYIIVLSCISKHGHNTKYILYCLSRVIISNSMNPKFGSTWCTFLVHYFTGKNEDKLKIILMYYLLHHFQFLHIMGRKNCLKLHPQFSTFIEFTAPHTYKNYIISPNNTKPCQVL